MKKPRSVSLERARWLPESGWGVFHHYLVPDSLSAEDWNRKVDGFDVKGLADQLTEIGAGHYCFTIGQTSGHYCAPNATYDRIAGISPSKCSRRDLIADLAAELRPRGIRMMVYSCSQAPLVEPEKSRFGWEWGFDGPAGAWSDPNGDPLPRTGKRLADFQERWEAVHREWSERWGTGVDGWWIDSCYFADAMYRHPSAPNFESFAAALRAGNPDGALAFNNGWVPPLTALTDAADFTAGEAAVVLPEIPGSSTQEGWHAGTYPPPYGKQIYVLSYLGTYWGKETLRFPDELIYGYTRHVIENGAAISWDTAVSESGRIPESAMRQLLRLKDLRPTAATR